MQIFVRNNCFQLRPLLTIIVQWVHITPYLEIKLDHKNMTQLFRDWEHFANICFILKY